VLLGVNPYKTVDELVLDKLGVGKKFQGNAATRAGQRLEPHVAAFWAERNNKVLTPGEFCCDADVERFIGTPDFLYPNGVLEIKTGAWKTWENGLVPMYEYQLRWYMMLKKAHEGRLVACIVPKDRSQIPQEDVHLWVREQQHCEFELTEDIRWIQEAQSVALDFLDRLDALKSVGQKLLRPDGDSLESSWRSGLGVAPSSSEPTRPASQ